MRTVLIVPISAFRIPNSCETPQLHTSPFTLHTFYAKIIPIRRTIKAMIQAIPHCHSTTAIDHFRPSSLRIAAIAATQGV